MHNAIEWNHLKKNKHGACKLIISFCSVKIVQVFFFSVSTIKQFVMGEKRLFFSALKATIEKKNPAFLGLFERIEKDRETGQMPLMRS